MDLCSSTVSVIALQTWTWQRDRNAASTFHEMVGSAMAQTQIKPWTGHGTVGSQCEDNDVSLVQTRTLHCKHLNSQSLSQSSLTSEKQFSGTSGPRHSWQRRDYHTKETYAKIVLRVALFSEVLCQTPLVSDQDVRWGKSRPEDGQNRKPPPGKAFMEHRMFYYNRKTSNKERLY